VRVRVRVRMRVRVRTHLGQLILEQPVELPGKVSLLRRRRGHRRGVGPW
jgi:hypothetical protein